MGRGSNARLSSPGSRRCRPAPATTSTRWNSVGSAQAGDAPWGLGPPAATLLAACAAATLLAACAGAEAPPAEDFAVVASMDVGLNPHQIAFSPDGSVAYIAAAGSDRITHVDVASLAVSGRTAVPGTPLGIAVLPGGGQVWVSRFEGEAVARYDLATGLLVDTIPMGGRGASLFAPLPGNRWMISVEGTDRMWVLDGAAAAPVADYPVGRRPFPPAATSDGRLAFVPGYDDGSLTVVDLWNDTVVGSARVGEHPSGGVVLHGDVDYVAAVRGADRLAFVNTADFTVHDTLLEGIGTSPFSVVLSPNGKLAFVNNTGSNDVSVVDVATRTVVARLPVPSRPIVVAVHPSGETVWVNSEGEDRLTVFSVPVAWRGGTIDHDGFLPNPGAPGAAAWRGPGEDDFGAPVPDDEKTLVAFMGMIHGDHRTSTAWGLEQVRQTVRNFKPDVVCTEIPPDRWARILRDFQDRDAFEDPRIRVFPEYVDVLLPLSREMGFQIEPCAGWTQAMNDQRRTRLADLAANPNLAQARAAYEGEVAAARERTQGAYGGNDDPRFIHSDAYDAAAREELDVYDRHLNDFIGPGGWTNINVAHWRLIRRAVERNHGKRVLVTFGGGHKYWQLDRLKERRDVTLLDLRDYLPVTRPK